MDEKKYTHSNENIWRHDFQHEDNQESGTWYNNDLVATQANNFTAMPSVGCSSFVLSIVVMSFFKG